MDNLINNDSNKQINHSQESVVTLQKKHDKTAIEDHAKKFSSKIAKKKTKNNEQILNDKLKNFEGKKPTNDKIIRDLYNKKKQNTSLEGKNLKQNAALQGENLKQNATLQGENLKQNAALQGENLKQNANLQGEKLKQNNTLNSDKTEVSDKNSEINHNVSINNPSLLSINNPTTINNATADLNALLEKLADKIYTTAISSKADVLGSEVKISLKNSILPNTEIHIQRTNSEITVSFNTQAEQSKALLINNESSLQKILTEKFAGDKIQVNINLSQEQNEGRSRNQYFSEEQLNDENKGQ